MTDTWITLVNEQKFRVPMALDLAATMFDRERPARFTTTDDKLVAIPLSAVLYMLETPD